MIQCNGLCGVKFKVYPYYRVPKSEMKRKCRVCEVVYLEWEGLWCPCCGTRTSGRIKNSKKNNRNAKRI